MHAALEAPYLSSYQVRACMHVCVLMVSFTCVNVNLDAWRLVQMHGDWCRCMVTGADAWRLVQMHGDWCRCLKALTEDSSQDRDHKRMHFCMAGKQNGPWEPRATCFSRPSLVLAASSSSSTSFRKLSLSYWLNMRAARASQQQRRAPFDAVELKCCLSLSIPAEATHS
eukprot:scaffold181766_cov24-Tisochrysis_lutea.AAC.1